MILLLPSTYMPSRSATEISVAKELKKTSIDIHLAQSLTRRAMVKWSTLGHSSVDVNLIAYGPNIEYLRGNHDNTEIGQFIAEQLNLDLPAIADKLNDPKNEKWLVNDVGRDQVQGGVRPGHPVKKRSHGGCGCMDEH
jgi:alkaline phosphatase